jgi:hypothetical protein
MRWIRDFALWVFAIFLMAGFVPIWAGALIASMLGRRDLSEAIFITGMLIWIAIRSWVGWRGSVAWRKSEDQRIKQGRESAGDIRRREGWEKKKLLRQEYFREAMRLRAKKSDPRNGKGFR